MHERLAAAAQFVRDTFGPGARVELEDDGSAYVTISGWAFEGFLSFDSRDEVQRMTIVP